MGHFALCPFMMKHFILLQNLIVYKKTLILQMKIILNLRLPILIFKRFINVEQIRN